MTVLATGDILTSNGQVSAWKVVARLLTGSVSGALTGPLLTISLALAYYDARVRKEGFDLQVMMAALSPPRFDCSTS